jgi:hypothetical protein
MSLYDQIYGSGTPENILYTTSTPAVTYPDAEFTNTLGTVFLPRIYGKDLSCLEIGTSGCIAITLRDIHSFDMCNTSNVIYFSAQNSEAFSIVPKDALKTTSLGDFTTNSSLTGQQEFSTTNVNGFSFSNHVAFEAPINGTDLSFTGSGSVGGSLQVVGAVTLSNTLEVVGKATLDSTLQVVGATALSNSLEVVGPTTLDSTLHTVGNAQLDSTLQVIGATALSNSLVVTGPTTLDSTLLTLGAATLSNTLEVVGSTTLDSTLHTVGATTLDSTLHTVGATTLDSTLHTVGAAQLDSTLQVIGAAALSNSLVVVGPTTLDSTLLTLGAATLSNTLEVVGATTLDSTLHTVGAATLDSTLHTVGATQLDSTLQVIGATALSNSLVVVGPTTLDATLLALGAATLSNTLEVVGATTLDSTLQTTGAVSLSNTLNVLSTTELQSNLIVDGKSLFNMDAQFKSNVTISNLVVTDSVSFSGTAPSIFNNLTVNGISTFNSNMYVNADVGFSNNFTLAGTATLKSTLNVLSNAVFQDNVNIDSNLYVVGTTQVLGAVSLSNTLNVAGFSTFYNTVAVGVDSNGINEPNVFLGIGTTTPTVSLDLSQRQDAINLPVGNTVARPTGMDGQIRYNNQIKRFEGYGNSAWSGLGGVISVNQDTYISAENFPGANNEQLRFFTSNIERMIIQANGNVGIGQTTDPSPGLNNNFWVTGRAYFNSDSVQFNSNITVENIAHIKTLAVSDSATVATNLTVGNTLQTDHIMTPSSLNITSPNIILNGNVSILGTLDTINTEVITVLDKQVTLASSGKSNALTFDGGLNDKSGFVVEGLPSNYTQSASNAKYYEKSLRWRFGASNGLQTLSQSTNALDDSYWELMGGSFLLSRWSCNYGADYADGTNYELSKIGFQFRISSNENLELVKVRQNSAGLQTAHVVSRFGISMPNLFV